MFGRVYQILIDKNYLTNQLVVVEIIKQLKNNKFITKQKTKMEMWSKLKVLIKTKCCQLGLMALCNIKDLIRLKVRNILTCLYECK